ncbi:MAG: phage tail protein [Streptosporangiaceae bacterium]
MTEPFLSEIRIMTFNFAPKGWALCNGQVLQISQNQPLFSLLGTTYGGDGKTTFALPNLQGSTPTHMGTSFPLGQNGGEQAHTLTIPESPPHTHAAYGATSASDSPIPAGNYLGVADNTYGPLAGMTAIQPATVTSGGGSQPHNNMQPYLVLTFCIALTGIYPSRN